MSAALKTNILLLTCILGILLMNIHSMPMVDATLSNTSLTIAVPSAPQGFECTIEATLKDVNGNPIPNMDIGFYECGTYKFSTATTDSNGVASLTYTFLGTGTYPVTVKFSGFYDTNTRIGYVRSSSEYVDIDIVAVDYIPYIAGGGLLSIVAMCFVGYIFYRRRK